MINLIYEQNGMLHISTEERLNTSIVLAENYVSSIIGTCTGYMPLNEAKILPLQSVHVFYVMDQCQSSLWQTELECRSIVSSSIL